MGRTRATGASMTLEVLHGAPELARLELPDRVAKLLIGAIARMLRRAAATYGATVCSRPSSFFSLNEVAVPFASRITHVCCVLEGPARLIPAACSDASIFTEGARVR